MSWHSIQKLIHTTSKKEKLGKGLDVMLICNSAERSIHKNCSEATARNASVVAYTNKALTVSVSGAAYAQDIRLHQRKIIKDLDNEIEVGIVERILYKI
ncbi:DciA family protein [Patescibacteria group bacterium]